MTRISYVIFLLIIYISLAPVTVTAQTPLSLTTITTLDELMDAVTNANITGLGVALSLEADITLEDSIHIGTTIYIQGNGHTISGQHITNIFFVGISGELLLNNITLTEGFSTFEGGAILNEGSLWMSNTTITNSAADMRGGALYTEGTTFIVNSNLSNNTSNSGGAIYSFGRLEIDSTIISDNLATRDGGGIALFGNGYTLITNTNIINNTAGWNGGGLHGGSTPIIINSLFNGNLANQSGGAIASSPVTSMTVINTTVSGNTAVIDGGGIFMGGSISMNNVTVTNNFASNNAGGVSGVANTRVTNTIIANNNAPNDSNCRELSGDDSNLSDDGCEGFGIITPDVDYETSLADNGGFTQTHALIDHSNNPAIDTGNALATVTDQRNVQLTNVRDIGAYEIGSLPTYPTISFDVSSESFPEEQDIVSVPVSLTLSGAENFRGVATIYITEVVNNSASNLTDTILTYYKFDVDCSVEDCTMPITLSGFVPIMPDNFFENDEQFELIIFGSRGFTVAEEASTWQATIEAISTNVSLSTAMNEETGSEEFIVNLGNINATGVPVIINYIVEGTAIAGEDYTALSGAVSIEDGEQYASIPILPAVEGDLGEGTVILTLSDTDNPLAIVEANPVTITLVDE